MALKALLYQFTVSSWEFCTFCLSDRFFLPSSKQLQKAASFIKQFQNKLFHTPVQIFHNFWQLICDAALTFTIFAKYTEWSLKYLGWTEQTRVYINVWLSEGISDMVFPCIGSSKALILIILLLSINGSKDSWPEHRSGFLVALTN